MNKHCIIFGATGAVGRELLHLCLNGDRYKKVIVVARASANISHHKLVWLQADFDDLMQLVPDRELTHGDAFCCLGTTIKSAGSQDNFRQVDFDYVLNSAKFCKKSGVKSFSMITSIGANIHSMSFYSKTKGEIEQAVIQIGLPIVRILRPSLLKGKRDEFRLKESVANMLMLFFNPIFLIAFKIYKPIEITQLARALYLSVNDEHPINTVKIYENDTLQSY